MGLDAQPIPARLLTALFALGASAIRVPTGARLRVVANEQVLHRWLAAR